MSFTVALKQGNWLNLRRVRAYPRIFLALFILLGGTWIFYLHEKTSPHDGAIVTDFINVYTAGLVTHEGHPAAAYDWNEHKSREDKIRQEVNKDKDLEQDASCISWLYPPMYLGIAWLVAFVPYWGALGIYSVAGFVAYAAALRKLVPPYQESLWALAAFPGVFINLFAGQNGFITTALLAAGLYLLDESPIAAGVTFGVMSYKPHFFALIPIALLAGRYWKTLAVTLASACVCAGLSLAAFGLESWLAFARGLGGTANLLKSGSDRWLGIQHSAFAMVRALGGGVQAAYIFQAIIAGFAISVLLLIWRRQSSSLEIRGASLAAALLLVTPYSFVYDQVLLSIPIALLARRGLNGGFLSYEKTFLFALWLLPFLVQDSGKHYALPLTPPMLVGLIIICWRRAKDEYSNTASVRPEFAKPEYQ